MSFASSALTKFEKQVRKSNVVSKFILHYNARLSTTAIGTLTTLFSADPSVCVDWGLVNGYFDEFRVIGMKISLTSLQQFSLTALNNSLQVVWDNDDWTNALASYNAGSQYQQKTTVSAVMVHDAGKTFTVTFLRPNIPGSPIPWIDNGASGTSVGGIKLYADSLNTSTAYFQVHVEYMVEARGRR